MPKLTLKNFTPNNLEPEEDCKVKHLFQQEDCNALWAAYAAGRPLLVRGEPGTGKSQLAEAIAEQLGWAFVKEVIHGNTELSDLHWHFDAIARLGEAQVQGIANTDQNVEKKLDPLRFISPGAFWWAYNWESAKTRYVNSVSRYREHPRVPATNAKWSAKEGGVVLLLDEIDKADPDLPNGLLETLGNYQFTVPYLTSENSNAKNDNEKNTPSNPIKANKERILVVITTNEERELPSAFVRRCFVHTLKMKTSTQMKALNGFDKKLEERYAWLIKRGRLHFKHTNITDEIYLKAAELLWEDRKNELRYPPGLAEYIDLLRTLEEIKDPQEQEDLLKDIAQYSLRKDADR